MPQCGTGLPGCLDGSHAYMSIELLVSKQNQDGGWPYVRGGSWTEPTVYAILALLSAGQEEPARRGLRWLVSVQRPDGGWPPQAGIEESSWVTALAALLSFLLLAWTALPPFSFAELLLRTSFPEVLALAALAFALSPSFISNPRRDMLRQLSS